MKQIMVFSENVFFPRNEEECYTNLLLRGVEEKYAKVLVKYYRLFHCTDFVPENLRHLLRLGATYTSVARELGIPYNTLKSEAYRFTKHIEFYLKDKALYEMFVMICEEKDLEHYDGIASALLRQQNIISPSVALREKFVFDIFEGTQQKRADNITEDQYHKVKAIVALMAKNQLYDIWNLLKQEEREYASYLLGEHDFSNQDYLHHKEILEIVDGTKEIKSVQVNIHYL
jgi:hypothetical protein